MAIAARAVVKRYPGVVALDGVTVELRDGEVLGVVGENGAGKSTLLDVLSGVVTPDAGAVELHGAPVALGSHRDANARGVFRVFQEQALIPNLRVDESLLLGHEDRLRRGPLLARRGMQRRAQALLDELGVPVDARARVETLDLGHRQAVEIARALLLAELLGIARPVVLFDEATAALDRGQVDAFLGWVRALRGRASVVLVSHFLPEVLATADRIVVLKDGAVVTQAPAGELDEPRLHALMVGRERAANHHREELQQPAGEEPLLRVRDLALPGGSVGGVSLDVHAGEIVGVGGLLGSGKSDLVRAIAGALPGATGTVQLADGPPARPRLRRLLDAGLGFVPAERGSEGLLLDASLLANLQLPSLQDRFAPRGWWRRGRARAATRAWIERLGIAAPGPGTPAGALSGGGQQKLVLAKWLERSPRVLLLDSPTRGVDTGAREAIYTLLREQSQAGRAVLLATDDLNELIGLSHRVVVMVRGRVAAVVEAPAGAKPSEQRLVTLMSGTPDAADERSAT